MQGLNHGRIETICFPRLNYRPLILFKRFVILNTPFKTQIFPPPTKKKHLFYKMRRFAIFVRKDSSLLCSQDCNELQTYHPNDCRCMCNNEDDRDKCNEEYSLKLWNPATCTCQCRETQECTSGFGFDYNTCRCAHVFFVFIVNNGFSKPTFNQQQRWNSIKTQFMTFAFATTYIYHRYPQKRWQKRIRNVQTISRIAIF